MSDKETAVQSQQVDAHQTTYLLVRIILAKDRYRRFTENVTKITSNVPLQVSTRQQYHSANVYFLVQESGRGSQTNWTQTKLGWHQTWG